MLHPDPLAVARFTHPALSSTHPLPRNPIPSHIHLSLSLALSLVFSPSLRAARSLDVAAALSNSRCNIQRLLAVVCGGGSAIATKKRAPRGRSLRPSNWRRCPSTVARAIVSLSLFSRPSCCRRFCLRPPRTRVYPLELLHNPPLPSPPLSLSLSHLPSLVFLLFLFLSLPPPLLRVASSSIGHRSVDATFE